MDFTSFDDVIYCQNLRHSARELAKFKATQPEGALKEITEGAAGEGQGGDEAKGATGGKVKVKRTITENEYYQRAMRLFRDKN